MQSMTTITTGATTLPAGLKEYYKVVVSPETLSHIIGTKTALLNITLTNDPYMTSPDKKRYNKFVRELNEMLTVWIKQNHSSNMRITSYIVVHLMDRNYLLHMNVFQCCTNISCILICAEKILFNLFYRIEIHMHCYSLELFI